MRVLLFRSFDKSNNDRFGITSFLDRTDLRATLSFTVFIKTAFSLRDLLLQAEILYVEG